MNVVAIIDKSRHDPKLYLVSFRYIYMYKEQQETDKQ